MKKYLVLLIVIFGIVLLMIPIYVLADNSGTCGENLTWRLDSSGNLYINGTGEMTSYSSYTATPWYNVSIPIKKIIITQGVTSIGSHAFNSFRELTDASIPDSVTRIGKYAFFNCTKLSDISLPDNIDNLAERVFGYCYNLANVTLPANLQTIDEAAFVNCESLSSIEIPEGVTSISNSVFSGCKRLSNIVLPNSIQSIEYATFWGAANLTEITIPRSVHTIESSAFAYCSGLSSIFIPDAVTSIASGAFSGCPEDMIIYCSENSYAKTWAESNTKHWAPHVHTLDMHEGFDATCMSTGTEDYWSCSVCNMFFSDAEATCIIDVPVIIPEKAHSLHAHAEVAATCTSMGTKAYWNCTVCGKLFGNPEATEEIDTPLNTPELGHDWHIPVYTWNENNSKVTASRVCGNDASHMETETVNASSRIITAASCEEKGEKIYTSGVFRNTAFVVQTKTVDMPALEHDWNNITYNWDADNSKVTASRICKRNASHIETETVSSTSEITRASTCEKTGQTTYRAVFQNASFETQTKMVNDVPATGHDWGEATYAWNADNSKVTARRVCGHDASHEETETVFTTYGTIRDATCESKGETTYTSLAFRNAAFEIQTKTVEDIPAKGHKWGTPKYTWNTDNSQVTARRICAYDTDHVEMEMVNSTSELTKAATCEEKGRTTYISENFANTAFTAQTKTVENIPALGHNWSEPTYTWNEDNSRVTASRICAHDENHVETETVNTISRITKAATRKANGETTYTSERFENRAFAVQTKTVADIPVLEYERGSCGEHAEWTIDQNDLLEITGTGEISTEAFKGRQDIKKVVIGEGITGIGAGAFTACINLEEVHLPESLNSIGAYAFSSCESIGQIKLPSELSAMGAYAFASCTGLEEIRIPGSLTTVGTSPFRWSTGLTSVTIEAGAAIIDYMFSDQSGLKSVTVLGEVSSWGNYAFQNCPVLTTVTFQGIVTNIGNYAFYNCPSLTTVTLQEGLKSIGSFAFKDCSGLTKIELPESLEEIQEFAFIGSGLQKIYLPENIEFNQNAFSGVQYYITNRFGKAAKQKIGDHLFQDPDYPGIYLKYDYSGNLQFYSSEKDMQNVIVPDGVTRFYFNASSNAEELVLPGSFTFVQRASGERMKVKKVILSEGITSVGESAFYGWSELEEVDLPTTLEFIGKSAFGNTSITSITIPDKVSQIDGYGFYYPFPQGCHLIFEKCSDFALSVMPYNNCIVEINHTQIVEYPRKEPSCTETGYEAWSCCEDCGKIITAKVEIPMTPHISVIDPAVPASERESGLTEGSHCSVCGEVLVAQEIIHPSWSSWEYEVRDEEAVIVGYNGIEKNVMVPAEFYDIPVSEIAANVFGSGNSPSRVYIPSSILSIDLQAFANHPTVYCDRYSEADYWAEEVGNETVYTDNTGTGTFYIIDFPEDFRLLRNDSRVISWSVWPKLSGCPISWSSSSPSIVQVEDGSVIGLLPGKSVITMTAGGKKVTVNITVYGPPDSFSLSRSKLDMITRTTAQLNIANITPSGSDTEITWSSSNTAVAQVDANGEITARRPGKTVVKATSQNGITRECVISVYYPVTEISFEEQSYTVSLHSAKTISALAQTEVDNIVYGNELLTFQSSNPSVASVTAEGTVQGKSVGTVTITATSIDGITGSVSLTVTCPEHQEATIPGTPATCTRDGYTELVYCSVCGTTLTNKTIIPALGHSEIIDKPPVYATCTKPGHTAVSHCERCGITLSNGEIIPAAGHVAVSDYDEEQAANDLSLGLSPGTYCRVCGIILQPQLIEPRTTSSVIQYESSDENGFEYNCSYTVDDSNYITLTQSGNYINSRISMTIVAEFTDHTSSSIYFVKPLGSQSYFDGNRYNENGLEVFQRSIDADSQQIDEIVGFILHKPGSVYVSTTVGGVIKQSQTLFINYSTRDYPGTWILHSMKTDGKEYLASDYPQFQDHYMYLEKEGKAYISSPSSFAPGVWFVRQGMLYLEGMPCPVMKNGDIEMNLGEGMYQYYRKIETGSADASIQPYIGEWETSIISMNDGASSFVFPDMSLYRYISICSNGIMYIPSGEKVDWGTVTISDNEVFVNGQSTEYYINSFGQLTQRIDNGVIYYTRIGDSHNYPIAASYIGTWHPNQIRQSVNGKTLAVDFANAHEYISTELRIQHDHSVTLTFNGKTYSGQLVYQDEALQIIGLPYPVYRCNTKELAVEIAPDTLLCYSLQERSFSAQTTLTLPASLTIIEESAFENIPVQKVVIPDRCSRIDAGAFSNCSGLQTIYLPDSVTGIHPAAFTNDKNILFVCESSNYAADYAESYGIPYITLK